MNVTFTITVYDYLQFNRFVTRKNGNPYVRPILNYSLPPVAGAVAVLSLSHSFKTAVTYGVALTVLSLPIHYFLKRRRVRKTFERQNLGLSHQVSVSPDGVTVVTPRSNSTLKWRAIVDVCDDGNYIYILSDNSTGLFIPKSSFPTRSEAAEFLHDAQSYWYSSSRTTVMQ